MEASFYTVLVNYYSIDIKKKYNKNTKVIRITLNVLKTCKTLFRKICQIQVINI